MEEISKVVRDNLGTGYYLEPGKALDDLFRAMKDRLNDTQANLKPLAAATVASLVVKLERDPAARVLRALGLGAALVAAFSDNKKGMREAVSGALNSITAADGELATVLLPLVGEGLAAKSAGRALLLSWLADHTPHLGKEVRSSSQERACCAPGC